MSEARMSKKDLCSEIKIARTTLDSILNGSDAKISTIEAIAGALRVPIGCLFDEGTYIIGRDNNGILSRGDNNTMTVGCDGTALMTEKIKHLTELVAEKDERIKELKERIEELKK